MKLEYRDLNTGGYFMRTLTILKIVTSLLFSTAAFTNDTIDECQDCKKSSTPISRFKAAAKKVIKDLKPIEENLFNKEILSYYNSYFSIHTPRLQAISTLKLDPTSILEAKKSWTTPYKFPTLLKDFGIEALILPTMNPDTTLVSEVLNSWEPTFFDFSKPQAEFDFALEDDKKDDEIAEVESDENDKNDESDKEIEAVVSSN